MYFATDVITGIKSRKRTQAFHVSCMGEIKKPFKALVRNSKRKGILRRGNFKVMVSCVIIHC